MRFPKMGIKDSENVPLLWRPKPDSGKLVKDFARHVSEKYGVQIGDYWDLHRWSVENYRSFWEEMWDMAGMIYSKKYEEVFPEDGKIEDTHLWFRGARFNYAENLLKFRDDHVALISTGEDSQTERITYARVYHEVCRYGAALRRCGLQKGDRFVCFMSNRVEAVYSMLGAASIGAIWTSSHPLMSSQAVIERLKPIQPKIMFAVDQVQYNRKKDDVLPKVRDLAEAISSLEKVIIVPSRPEARNKDISSIRKSCFLDEFLASGLNEDGTVPDLEFEQLPFDHPVFISYTSGTTGRPKEILHGAGIILSSVKDLYLHTNATRNDVWLLNTPPCWSVWNDFITSLCMGVTTVIFDGLPFYLSPTYFWDLIDELGITNLCVVPSRLDDLEKKGYIPTKKHHLSSLKMMISTGSVLKSRNEDFIYNKLKLDILFGSGYGITESFNYLLHVEQTLPVRRGQINCPSLGIDACVYDKKGNPVIGEQGQLVIRTPSPVLALGIWRDQDRSRFKKAYFSKYPGVFAPGDLCEINPVTKGFIVLGRSDDVMKPGGIRIRATEIYGVVDAFPEILDSVCVSQFAKNIDERIILFLKMKSGNVVTEDLIDRIKKAIENQLSIHHVPTIILQAEDIPYNVSGKKVESIVKRIISNMQYNADTIINPRCLDNYRNIPELQNF